MGYALPAAIGAAIGTYGKVPIVCVIGDGGLQMNVQELSTLASLKLPVTVVVINNVGYGIIKQFQDAYFNSRYIATSAVDLYGTLTGPDFCKIAEAYGILAMRTHDVLISLTCPVLYDVLIDPNQKIFPKLEFGNALENMAPYRPELLEHMIAPVHTASCESGWVSP
jgi:acetolactate synthase-1/2/3 large subunit